MRNRKASDDAPASASAEAAGSDRYPTLKSVFARILEADDIPTGPVDRVVVTALASGEATANVYPARSDEAVGVYLAAE